MEAGVRGRIDLTLPDLKLMPNNFLLYVCLTRPENAGSYDVLDSNVSLPALVLKSNSANEGRLGAVTLNYEFQSSGAEKPATISVAVDQI